jgi:hypothetical protein
MGADLTETIVAWASDVALRAAQLPSKAARARFLASQRRQLLDQALGEGMGADEAAVLADSCIAGAERIMVELVRRGIRPDAGRA